MKQNVEWIKFVGPEGQVGILKSSVAETVINFWGNYVLQQWGAQFSIPIISETAHKMMFKLQYVPGKGTGKNYQRKSKAIERQNRNWPFKSGVTATAVTQLLCLYVV